MLTDRLKSGTQFLSGMDRKAFGVGMAGVLGLYALLWLYAVSFHGAALKSLESTLASQVVPVTMKEAATTEDDHAAKKEIPLLIEGVYQKTEAGNLPIVRESDGLTSFTAYKKPFSMTSAVKPVLTIIISDFGLSKSSSEMAYDILPPEVTYSLSPYADMPGEWAKILRQSGREFWMNIPFENVSENPSDSGAYTIFTKSSYVKNQKAMHRALTQAQSYPGVSTSFAAGQKESHDISQIKKAGEEIFGRGLGILELNPKPDPALSNLALSKNAPYIKADVELVFTPDNDPFAELEEILNSKGYAVAVVQNYPNNVKRLAEWLLKVAQPEYQLAPASAIYDLPLYLERQKTKKANAQVSPQDNVAAPVAPQPAAATSPPAASPASPPGDLLATDKAAPPGAVPPH